MSQILDAVARINKKDSRLGTHMDKLMARINTTSWQPQPSVAEKTALYAIVSDLIK
jgi:hypothetical protein